MWPLFLVLGIVTFLLIILLIGLFVVYRISFYSPIKGQNNDFGLTGATVETCDVNKVNGMIRRMVELPHEDVYIKSFDKTKLRARLFKNENSNTVCIMAHGYRGTACRDFSGGAYDMIQKGFNVILIDERAHGLSGGHTITFGVKERKDINEWIEYAKSRFGEDKRIVLIGISMGGATVLAASKYLSKKDKVIADCPFSKIRDILYDATEKLKLNSKVCYPFVWLSAVLFAHFNPNKFDASKDVKNSAAKILIIHGNGDTLVPYTHSERVYLENKDKVQYEIFEGAEHGLSYMVDQNRYQRIVNEFLDKE